MPNETTRCHEETTLAVSLHRRQWERVIEALEWDTGLLGHQEGDFDIAEAIRDQIGDQDAAE